MIEIVYQGVQRDEGKGEEIAIRVGKDVYECPDCGSKLFGIDSIEVRIEDSPSYRDILIIDEDRTVVIKLDENYHIKEIFEERG